MEDILKNKKILFVDDEEMILSIYESFFADSCDHIEVALNGLEALEKIKESDFDIIISDIKMPKCDGISFYNEFKKIRKGNEKFIFVTGYSDISREDATKMGVTNLFAKPTDMNELVNYVSSLF